MLIGYFQETRMVATIGKISRNCLGAVRSVEIEDHPTIGRIYLGHGTYELIHGEEISIGKAGVRILKLEGYLTRLHPRFGSKGSNPDEERLSITENRKALSRAGVALDAQRGYREVVLENPDDLAAALKAVGGFEADSIAKLEIMLAESTRIHTDFAPRQEEIVAFAYEAYNAAGPVQAPAENWRKIKPLVKRCLPDAKIQALEARDPSTRTNINLPGNYLDEMIYALMERDAKKSHARR